jgi:DNA-directed RNA polymerase I, II, and III subunit RPABC2
MAEYPEISDSDVSDDELSETSSVGIINKKPKKTVRIIDPDEEDMVEESDAEESEEEQGEGEEEDMEEEDTEYANEKKEMETHFPEIEDDDEEDDEDEEDYLKKFDESLHQNIIRDHHPELHIHNYEEIDALCTIVRNENGDIVDPFHRTLPIITRYERARVIGERAKQIDAGAQVFVEVEDNIIDAYLIALKEYEAKKIPFILQRPLPNGACEYWRLSDLEILA